MADDRWTTWQAEQANTHSGPTIGQAFGLFAAIALVLLALAWSPLATAQSVQPEGRSLCAEHRGDPGWRSVCAEDRRR